MNKKGFTMIELLATMVILGILSTIGVVSVTRYVRQSKVKSYRMMSQSIYEAAMNCIVQNKCDMPTPTNTVSYTTEELITMGYIKKLENPGRKSSACNGIVTIGQPTMSQDEYKKLYYAVELHCSGVSDATLVWPYSKSVDVDDIIDDSSSNLEEYLATQ